MLGAAGYSTLNDVLDLEREDAGKLPGMTPELAEQLMAFLQELTDGRRSRRGRGAFGVTAPLLGLLGLGLAAGHVVVGVDGGSHARCRRASAACVVIACDAESARRGKGDRLARGKGLPVIVGPVADELGRRAGPAAGAGGRGA